MKTEKDRRAFALILGVLPIILLVICSLYNRKNEYSNLADGENSIYRDKIENKSLELQIVDNDTFIVTGDGKLSSKDLEYLLLQNDARVSDVVNLIISGEIKRDWI